MTRAIDPSTATPVPIRNPWSWLVHIVSKIWLKVLGWEFEGDWPPEERKLVVVAAPHTSNWDGLYMLLSSGYYGVKIKWMGKKSLTTGPFGWFLKWLGCVPVDRDAATDMVDQMREAFAKEEKLILAVPPEGTRSTTERWKSGFYRIAHAADVPILLTVLDFGTRKIKLAALYTPGGDYEKDLPEIQSYYKGAKGLHRDKFDV